MTKVPVNVPGFTANMMYGAPKMQCTDATGEFGKILESQKNVTTEKPQEVVTEKEVCETAEEPAKEDAVGDDTVREEKTEEVTDRVNRTEEAVSVKETETAQNGQGTGSDLEQGQAGELSEEVIELIMPLLQNAVGDIKEVLAQELGISQEELNTLMENMGLRDMDLLDGGTLKEIFLQVKGLDMTELLTNEELYGQMQSLEGAFEEVMATVQETLQVDEEELHALREQLPSTVKEPVIFVETEESLTASKEQSTGGEEQNLQNNAFATPNQNLQNVQNTVNQQSLTQAQSASYSGVETQNIMNQIMDYMKIQLSPETSTLEMQLQPESLGTLQVRISAKEGIMTAQFTTASESIKSALEGQMVQLQQQFEAQNIKVEAIEVTVQTHQFESALQQGEAKEQQAEEGKKSRVRKIDLNQLENVEEISEEERLVAEMMAASGSTVDYLA